MDERRTGSARLSIRRRAWADVSPGDYRRITSIWEGAFPPAERGAHDTVTRRNSTWLWTAHSADSTGSTTSTGSAGSTGSTDSPDSAGSADSADSTGSPGSAGSADRLIGFATAVSLPTARAAYLEYLAVLPSERGSGAGAAVLAAVADDLRAEPSVRGIALEVEDPDRTPTHDPLLARRVAFYARWGARPVTSLHDYSMPDLAHPGERVPMILLWRGLHDDRPLDPDDVARVLTDLYHRYYAHSAAAGHLEEMLTRIHATGVDG